MRAVVAAAPADGDTAGLEAWFVMEDARAWGVVGVDDDTSERDP